MKTRTTVYLRFGKNSFHHLSNKLRWDIIHYYLLIIFHTAQHYPKIMNSCSKYLLPPLSSSKFCAQIDKPLPPLTGRNLPISPRGPPTKNPVTPGINKLSNQDPDATSIAKLSEGTYYRYSDLS